MIDPEEFARLKAKLAMLEEENEKLRTSKTDISVFYDRFSYFRIVILF